MKDDKYFESNEIDLLDFVGLLYRYRYFTIGLTVLLSLIVAIFLFISAKISPLKSSLPTVYTANSLLYMKNSGKKGSSYSSLMGDSSLGNIAAVAGITGGSSDVGLAKKLLRTKYFLDALIDEVDAVALDDFGRTKEQIRGILAPGFNLTTDPDSSMAVLSFKDIDPDVAAAIVNTAVEMLVYEFERIEQISYKSNSVILESKLEEVQEKILELDKERTELVVDAGLLDPISLSTEYTARIMRFKNMMIEIDAEIESITSDSDIRNPVILEKYRLKETLENSLDKMIHEGSYGLPSMLELQRITQEYNRILNEIKVQEAIFLNLTEQFQMVRLTEKGSSPSIIALEKAITPQGPSGPNRKLYFMLSVVLIYFFSVIITLSVDYLRNIMHDPVKKQKVLGQKPYLTESQKLVEN